MLCTMAAAGSAGRDAYGYAGTVGSRQQDWRSFEGCVRKMNGGAAMERHGCLKSGRRINPERDHTLERAASTPAFTIT